MLAVTGGADVINHVRLDHDGSVCRYRAPAWRGRCRIPLCHLPHGHDEFVLHSGRPPSSRVQVYPPYTYLFPVHPCHVLAAHPLLHHQSKRRHLGHSWGPGQEDQEGMVLEEQVQGLAPCWWQKTLGFWLWKRLWLVMYLILVSNSFYI